MKKSFLILPIALVCLNACKDEKPKKKVITKLDYNQIVETIKSDSNSHLDIADNSNMLDANEFDPSKDSLSGMFDSLAKVFEKDSAMVKQSGIVDSGVLANNMNTNAINNNDTFTKDIKKIQVAEIKALKFNLDQVHKTDSATNAIVNTKKRIERRVWARVNKTDQRLYLYLDGKLVDTFKVSTGDRKHETPLIDRQPAGPIFQKYTSKKYPGGNYNGLGNMPYVVFVQGGYALHGTTKGNIPKLGNKASHGCVRLHPDNAKIFNELVRKVGIQNTWVTIEK